MEHLPLLSLLILIPLVAGAVCLFLNANGARWTALIANTISVETSAIQRAAFALRGKHNTAPASGTMISRLSKGSPFTAPTRLPSSPRRSGPAASPAHRSRDSRTGTDR